MNSPEPQFDNEQPIKVLPPDMKLWPTNIGLILYVSWPILTLVILLIVNYSYVSEFFLLKNQPLGLGMLGVMLAFSTLAYVVLFFGSKQIDSQTTRRYAFTLVLKMCLYAGVTLFMIFPAEWIVLLGPAALLLRNSALSGILF